MPNNIELIARKDNKIGESSPTVDLDKFVDERRINAFHINLVVWSLIATIADGFDLNAMGFAAPEIIKSLGIDRGAMGLVLSASMIGMLPATPVAGYLGDRFGRKPLMVGAVLLFGVATWATVLAETVAQFVALRALAGVGLAGIIPNVTALVIESTPRRVQGAFVVIVQMGIQVGAMIPGLIAAHLVVKYGWQAIFHVGGAAPVLLAVTLIFILPESIKFLARDPARRPKLLRIARSMDPGVRWDDNTLLVQHLPKLKTSLSPTVPFQNNMHVITSLVWMLAIISLFTNFLIFSWAPTVLRDLGVSPESAALTVTFFALGGVVGSLVLTFGFNRYGFLIVTIFYFVAVPTVACLGYAERGFLPWLVFLAGICVSGSQSAINSAFGILYPTPIRANSAGWGMAIARLGSIGGPLFGGFMMGRGITGEQFFVMAAAPIAIGFCVALMLTWRCHLRFNGWSLHDRAIGS